MKPRKFDNFKTAITDPDYFFGRDDFLKTITKAPFKVQLLFGGRRIGKTSALRAVEWSFLNPDFNGNNRAFPVLVNLQIVQPNDTDNFRYILISLLREAIERWKNTKLSKLRETYLYYLRQVISGQINLGPFFSVNITNPDNERRLSHDDFRHILLKFINELRNNMHFNGVCFLLDESEYIVRQNWGNNACSYIRGIKDTDTALKEFIGFIFSGYRVLKNYNQKVGSPLSNISDIHWLCSLSESEARDLINFRSKEEKALLNENIVQKILDFSGCHPFLIQQMLNIVFDNLEEKSLSLETIMEDMLWQHDQIFSKWWNAEGNSDGFGEEERKVYQTLIGKQKGTYEDIVNSTQLSVNKVRNALQVLVGTGILKRLDVKQYEINSLLFEKWVSQECL